MPDTPKKPWRISATDRTFLRGLRIKAEDSAPMKGRRLPDGEHQEMPAGSYSRDGDGRWEACCPNGRRGLLTDHTITEHDDGTITVAPSIRIDPIVNKDGSIWRPGWHGFLEAGVWREV